MGVTMYVVMSSLNFTSLCLPRSTNDFSYLLS